MDTFWGMVIQAATHSVVLWLAIITLASLVSGYVLSMGLDAQRWKVQAGTEAMVGKTATVVVPLKPVGKVFVESALWEAKCPTPVEKDALVRIVRVEGMRLHVEPIIEDDDAPVA